MDRTCIVAIDFGTAYSGYAYSLTVSHEEKLRCKRWESRAGADTAKTPTCILFDQNAEFMDFGYKARDTYYDIRKNTSSYFYFRDFKMELYKQTVTKDLVIKDVNQRPMSAIKVFSAALHFLKEDALKSIAKETPTMSLAFTWVLTVPAIWDNPARQFMREAATRAGMDSSSLQIALEPEAASIWCKQLYTELFLEDAGVTPEVTLSAGTQYILVDCGGGTIDITAHEILEGGGLKELCKASGNNKAGQAVHKEFTRCMRQFFCDGLWKEYELCHPREAQLAKEDFLFFSQTDNSHTRLLTLSENFRKMIENRKNKSKNSVFTLMDGVTLHLTPYSAKLEISESKMCSLFHKTLDHLVDNLKEILQKQSGIKYVLLVGGLSSSHMLRKHVQKKIRDQTKVLCPKNPQEAILKGAVMFGLDPSVIRTRKCGFTYGFSKIMRFDPSKHHERKQIKIDDVLWCKHLFKKMVEINEDVGWDETREFSVYPLEDDQNKMSFDFYRTEKKDPLYVDERGVQGPVASCDVILPTDSRGMDHEVRLKIYFGSTTIRAEAKDVSVTMDFWTQAPNFSSAPSSTDTPNGFPSKTPVGGRSSSSSGAHQALLNSVSSLPATRQSLKSRKKEPPSRSDHPLPLSSRPSQRILNNGEVKSSSTKLPSYQTTAISSRGSAQPDHRPVETEPLSASDLISRPSQRILTVRGVKSSSATKPSTYQNTAISPRPSIRPDDAEPPSASNLIFRPTEQILTHGEAGSSLSATIPLSNPPTAVSSGPPVPLSFRPADTEPLSASNLISCPTEQILTQGEVESSRSVTIPFSDPSTAASPQSSHPAEIDLPFTIV